MSSIVSYYWNIIFTLFVITNILRDDEYADQWQYYHHTSVPMQPENDYNISDIIDMEYQLPSESTYDGMDSPTPRPSQEVQLSLRRQSGGFVGTQQIGITQTHGRTLRSVS